MPPKRIGAAEEVANAVLFLSSPVSTFVDVTPHVVISRLKALRVTIASESKSESGAFPWARPSASEIERVLAAD